VTDAERPSGPLDVATLEVLARRGDAHPLVDEWAFRPDELSPRRLELQLDVSLWAVYEALAYYYDNIEEIRSFERANPRARDRVHDAGLQPKDPVA
jgi:hypothetical protein